MSNNVVLECNKIWKKYGNRVIIQDLSFKLYQGDILGFIGSNGAGKTTSIKLMLGLQFFNGGTVKIGGFDLKKDFSRAISNVGAIVETPDLYMYMSGYENLKIAASMYSVTDERILEVVKLVGLEDCIYDKVRTYSLGMRERLGIAQAILHHPKILILDEPMNGLDPNGMNDLKVLLQKLAHEEHLAILISSHILSELESFCNRICILMNGRIIQDKKIEEIKKITNQENYILEVSRVDLQKMLYQFEIIDDCHIKISASKEKIVNILKTLLLNDVLVFEIRRESITLEEIFLKLMKEQKND